MQELQQTGKVAGELRSIKKVEVIPETTVVLPAQMNVEHTFYGPCLLCGKDMQYSLWFRTRDKHQAEDWLLTQFESNRRKAHASYLEGRRKEGFIELRKLEGIVCESCRAICAESRAAVAKRKSEREEVKRQTAARQREQYERERERWEYHTTWRDAQPAEFANLRDGVARFTVSVPGKRPNKVLFRWRAVGGRCRGDSPRSVVGMWVDRKFITRYHGWNIAPLEGQRPYFEKDLEWYDGDNCFGPQWPPADDSGRQDVFGVGFCRWLEGAFQAKLLRLKPAATWTAKTKRDSWPLDVPTLREIKTPGVVHTHWIDGSVYATLLCDTDLPKVCGFADQQLAVKIEPLTVDG